MNSIFFFLYAADSVQKSICEEECIGLAKMGLHMEIWHPKLFSFKPRGGALYPFLIWYFFYRFGLFKSKDYAVYLIYNGDELVHRSCIFPPFFRFPFMMYNDIQVGYIWTSEEYRFKGLSKYALNSIVKHYRGRCVWYLCDSSNISSNALAKSVGFKLHAQGVRLSRFGINALGKYSISKIFY